MKFRRSMAHLVAAIALLLSVACAASAQLPHQGKPPDNHNVVGDQNSESQLKAIANELQMIREQNAEHDDRTPRHTSEWIFGDKAPVWSNWILACVALLAGIVAIRAFNHERDAVRMTERADVVIQDVNVTLVADELNVDSLVEIVMKNFGRTRAINVMFSGAFGVPGGDELEEVNPPPGVIAAGGEMLCGFHGTLGTYIPVDAIASINKGKLPLKLSVTIRYDNIFKDHYVLDYVGVWNVERRSFQIERSDVTEETRVG